MLHPSDNIPALAPSSEGGRTMGADLPSLTLGLRDLADDQSLPLGAVLERVFALDDQAGAFAAEIQSRYFENALGGVGRGQAAWQIGWHYQQTLFFALAGLLSRDAYAINGETLASDERGALLTRALRAGRGVVRWEAFHYGPFDETVWARLSHVYAQAEADGLAWMAVDLPEGKSSPRREFMAAVALRCGALDSLPLELMEMADRLIFQVAHQLQLEPQWFPESLWQLNPGSAAAPRRLLFGDTPRSGYFLGPGQVGAVLEAIQEDLRQGRLARWAVEDGEERMKALACQAHLRKHWLGSPTRRYRRHALSGQVSLVQGWHSMLSIFGGAMESKADVLELCDVSAGGLALRGRGELVTKLRIGDLVGVRDLAGGEWQLCAVRRLQQEAGSTMAVGLEVIARQPRLVDADDGQRAIQGLLCDTLRPGAAVRFISPTQALHQEGALFVKNEGGVRKLRPLGQPARGQLYELREFQVL